MIKMFLNNFKALVKPAEFVDLTYERGWLKNLYAILMCIIIGFCLIFLPSGRIANDLSKSVNEWIEPNVPDFTFERQQLTVNTELPFIFELNDADSNVQQSLDYKNVLIFADTRIPNFEYMNQGSKYYFAKYLTDKQIDEINGYRLNGFMFSQGNMIQIKDGQVYLLSYAELCDELGKPFIMFSKDSLMQEIPYWMSIIVHIIALFSILGLILGLYFFSIFWAIIGKIVNAIVGTDYTFGQLYGIVLFIRIPMYVFKYSFSLFLSDMGTNKTLTWICRIFMLVYLILALKLKGKQQYSFKDVAYSPDGSMSYYTTTSMNNNNDDLFSSKPFYPMDDDLNFDSNNNMNSDNNNNGFNQGPKYSPGAVYKPEEHTTKNTGYNPNPAYGENNNLNSQQDPLYSTSNVYQPNTNTYSVEDLNSMHAGSEGKRLNTERKDLAQDSSYADKTLVWKPKTPETDKAILQKAYSSQEWDPQAQTDYKGEKEKWNQASAKWDFDQKKNFNQQWNPQKTTETASQNNNQFSQNVWKAPQNTNNSTEDLFQEDKASRGYNANSMNNVQQEWNQTPVWGKKNE